MGLGRLTQPKLLKGEPGARVVASSSAGLPGRAASGRAAAAAAADPAQSALVWTMRVIFVVAIKNPSVPWHTSGPCISH